nr:M18 family aminopeptidase [Treponema sp.]
NNKFSSEMLSFISNSPSCFHVVDNLGKILEEKSFTKLQENERWNIKKGGRYYVTRNNSAIIAFTIPENDYEAFMISASHSDSPSFKIKENPSINSGIYIKLNVEKYGGMLCAPWYDRPLSVAGRVICKEKTSDGSIRLKQHLVNVDRDLLMIPNLAIHMNRDANTGIKYNVQDDMLPVFAISSDKDAFMKVIAESAGVDLKEIVSYDLYLYNRVAPSFWGANNEFIASAKLDDLECAYTTTRAFADSETDDKYKNINVLAVFDNEEVGSGTRQGADSTFLEDVLQRVNNALGRDFEDYKVALAKSFMVSADNAHAVHPNYTSVADPVNRPSVNAGIVIKFNAAQKYATDSIAASLFRSICDKVEVPYQCFTNRSDIAGGSTLGNISGAHVSISTVDIGLAQWAMHSPYESAGAEDPEFLYKAIKEFYKTTWSLNE